MFVGRLRAGTPAERSALMCRLSSKDARPELRCDPHFTSFAIGSVFTAKFCHAELGCLQPDLIGLDIVPCESEQMCGGINHPLVKASIVR